MLEHVLLYIFVVECKAPDVKAESGEQPKKSASPSPVVPGYHHCHFCPVIIIVLKTWM